MAINELLDDDAFDPKKLFDEKKYSTLIINREGFSKKENSSADLIEDLLEKEISRQEAEEIYSKLKEANAGKLLVSAIKEAGRTEDKRKLVAACWECGFDLTDDILLFVELACNDDFRLALEALTVVENTETTLPPGTLKTAREIAEGSKSRNTDLVADLKENLKQRDNA